VPVRLASRRLLGKAVGGLQYGRLLSRGGIHFGVARRFGRRRVHQADVARRRVRDGGGAHGGGGRVNSAVVGGGADGAVGRVALTFQLEGECLDTVCFCVCFVRVMTGTTTAGWSAAAAFIFGARKIERRRVHQGSVA